MKLTCQSASRHAGVTDVEFAGASKRTGGTTGIYANADLLAVKSRLRTDARPSSVPKSDLGRSLVVRMSGVPTGYTSISTRRSYGFVEYVTSAYNFSVEHESLEERVPAGYRLNRNISVLGADEVRNRLHRCLGLGEIEERVNIHECWALSWRFQLVVFG